MTINTYKSLYKPMTWGGIPRVLFILIVLFSIISIILFKSIRGVLPIAAIYGIILLAVRVDYYIFNILFENLRYKDAYLPD